MIMAEEKIINSSEVVLRVDRVYDLCRKALTADIYVEYIRTATQARELFGYTAQRASIVG